MAGGRARSKGFAQHTCKSHYRGRAGVACVVGRARLFALLVLMFYLFIPGVEIRFPGNKNPFKCVLSHPGLSLTVTYPQATLLIDEAACTTSKLYSQSLLRTCTWFNTTVTTFRVEAPRS
ncbi:hypothetical protein LX32DRAFT_254502 [Colletotrichum zoysiae]|uniref:Uncharacterized protein n=1 Tax=Colletotrichum zoysiae TaxID=1216348 RepID=A0AAD9M5B4_9PEZI|nr:hypothetical protein LX32DRAFT_254502 [Colletotrichum zoysiae]